MHWQVLQFPLELCGGASMVHQPGLPESSGRDGITTYGRWLVNLTGHFRVFVIFSLDGLEL